MNSYKESILTKNICLDFTNSTKNESVWLIQWNGLKIPGVNNALIILDEIDPNQFNNLLNQEGIQSNLLNNFWLIHSSNESREAKDYFHKNKLKIGLNAQIVFVKKWANEYQDVIQILGTGTSQVSYKVHL